MHTTSITQHDILAVVWQMETRLHPLLTPLPATTEWTNPWEGEDADTCVVAVALSVDD